MSGWHTERMALLDTESSGLDVDEARVVTWCLAEVGGGQPTHIEQRLLNPGIDIPAEATAVHGITTEQARRHGLDPVMALGDLSRLMTGAWSTGMPIVAFNAAYDLTLLDREFRRHLGQALVVAGPVIDPMVLDKQLDPWRKGKRTLAAQCDFYDVRLDAAHDSTEDALAAGRVAWAIARRYPQVAGMHLMDLHDAQAKWRAQQQADFAAYLRRQGKPDDDVDGAWPLRPLVGSVAA